jgi:DNA ligase-1
MIKKHANNAEPGTREYTSSTYLFGKGTRILKLKDFFDEEAECIGLKNSSGSEEGCAMLQIRDIRGNEFYIRMRGSFERRRHWFQHPEEIIGKQITFRYQTLSVYGVPIFPVGIEVRDYE